MDLLLIIGLASAALCYPLWKVLEKMESRWSNAALAILTITATVCLGMWVCIWAGVV